MNQKWTPFETAFVRDNAGHLLDRELAASLTRLTGRPVSAKAVQHIRRDLGIAKAPGRGCCRVVRRLPQTYPPI